MEDLGHFFEEKAFWNRGKKYVIMAWDGASEVIACYPTSRKTQEAWESATRKFLRDDFRFVRVICTDRDASVSGERFQHRLKDELSIRWTHLLLRTKAFWAELAVAS